MKILGRFFGKQISYLQYRIKLHEDPINNNNWSELGYSERNRYPKIPRSM